MQTLTESVTTIIYEYPLNEAIRMCLRLEHIFNQFDKATRSTQDFDIAINSLLQILEATNRPDIKSKLSQVLTQFNNSLTQLKSSSKVNNAILDNELIKLANLQKSLHATQSRANDELRQNEFLYNLRTNALTAGGSAEFQLPALLLWKQQPATKKIKDLQTWMLNFQPLKQIINEILSLTRTSTTFENVTADKGFFHKILNASHPYQLARICIPASTNLYPEFSAGKHRLTIRFLTPNYFNNGRPQQTKDNINFELCCCKL